MQYEHMHECQPVVSAFVCACVCVCLHFLSVYKIASLWRHKTEAQFVSNMPKFICLAQEKENITWNEV